MKTMTKTLAIGLFAAFAAFAVIPAQAGDGGCCGFKGAAKGGAALNDKNGSCDDKATSGGCEKKSSCADKKTSGGCEKK
jgi:hypothetical protein